MRTLIAITIGLSFTQNIHILLIIFDKVNRFYNKETENEVINNVAILCDIDGIK